MQYLYLLESDHFCKIGIANNVEGRIAQLSTGNPHEIRLLVCFGFENAEHVERAIHQKFDRLRERGEWYKLTASDVDIFRQIAEILGGEPYSGFDKVTPDDVLEAEEEQEHFLDNPNLRIEILRDENGVRGFSFRERSANRKLIKYIGKRNPEFDKLFSELAEEKNV